MKITELERFLNKKDYTAILERKAVHLETHEKEIMYRPELEETLNTDGISTMYHTDMRAQSPYLGEDEQSCKERSKITTPKRSRIFSDYKMYLAIKSTLTNGNYYRKTSDLVPKPFKLSTPWKIIWRKAIDHIEYDRRVYREMNLDPNVIYTTVAPAQRGIKRCLVIGDSSCLQGYTNKEIFDKLRAAINNCKTVEFVIDETTFLGQKIVELTKIDKMSYKAFNTAEFVDNKFTRFDFKRTLRVMNRALNYTQFAELSGVIVIRGYKDSILSDTVEKWAKRVNIPVKNLYLG